MIKPDTGRGHVFANRGRHPHADVPARPARHGLPLPGAVGVPQHERRSTTSSPCSRPDACPKKERVRDRAHELLAELQLTTSRTPSPSTLSGGERRRLEISRALATSRACCSWTSRSPASTRSPSRRSRRSSPNSADRGIAILITDHAVAETLRISDRAYILDQASDTQQAEALGKRSGLGPLRSTPATWRRRRASASTPATRSTVTCAALAVPSQNNSAAVATTTLTCCRRCCWRPKNAARSRWPAPCCRWPPPASRRPPTTRRRHWCATKRTGR